MLGLRDIRGIGADVPGEDIGVRLIQWKMTTAEERPVAARERTSAGGGRDLGRALPRRA